MSEKENIDKVRIKTIPKRNELITLLQNHSNLRTGQDQVLWGIFGAFWATNSLLLVSIFVSSENWNYLFVLLIISIVGILISIVWSFIQIRALRRIELYENTISWIEEKLCLPDEICAFYYNPKTKKPRFNINARKVMKDIGYLAIILWFSTFIYALLSILEIII
ncbi:MAG: hypothetical protein GWP19_12045 [Planctomycetia bacterium]|nr:hypothetical protein [Planctomycetia bacterium]